MKLYVMFGQREESYPGQYGPEALDFIWDEYCVDENPQGFEDACAKAMAEAKQNGFVRTMLMAVEVDQAKVAKLLNGIPELKGEVEEA